VQARLKPFLLCPRAQGGLKHANVNSDQWTRMNTFDTGGVCPACLHQSASTQCLSCRRCSAHSEWYVLYAFTSGNKPHTAAKAETTGCARACRRVFDSQPRGHPRSAVRCPERRRCALATRFRQWFDQRPSVTISNRNTGRSIRIAISKGRDCWICPL